MKFFKGFGAGFINFFKAFGFIFSKGLWHYFLISFAIWFLLFILSHVALISFAEFIKDWTVEQLQLDKIPDEGHWLSWAKGFLVKYLGVVIGWLMSLVIYFITGTITKYLMLMLLSPMLAFLSEAVDKRLNGVEYKFSFIQLLKDIVRGVLITLRNMIFELICIISCWILTALFPPIAIVTLPFLLILSWYFIGASLMDYTCERKKMGVIKSIRFIRSNKGIAVGTGLCYWLFMNIPLIGSFIGLIFAPVLAVTGATLSLQEVLMKEEDVQKKI